VKVSEFLAQARDELFKGWTKGSYQNSVGQVCAIGAIERVAMNTMAIEEAARAQAAINAKALEVHGVSQVQHINDSQATSKQDMLDLFDKAVIGLEERGE
jgi:hypothetical protein